MKIKLLQFLMDKSKMTQLLTSIFAFIVIFLSAAAENEAMIILGSLLQALNIFWAIMDNGPKITHHK